MKAKLLVVCVMVIAGLMLAQSALAKGVPMKVTISGTGLLSEIVVMNDEDAIAASVHIELDAIGAELECAQEGGQGVLGALARRAPVRDQKGLRGRGVRVTAPGRRSPRRLRSHSSLARSSRSP